MASKWFNVGNKTELEANQVSEQSVSLFFDGIGPKTVYFFLGNEFNVMIDGVFMMIGERGEEVTVRDDRALWLDPLTENLWVGIEDGT